MPVPRHGTWQVQRALRAAWSLGCRAGCVPATACTFETDGVASQPSGHGGRCVQRQCMQLVWLCRWFYASHAIRWVVCGAVTHVHAVPYKQGPALLACQRETRVGKRGPHTPAAG